MKKWKLASLIIAVAMGLVWYYYATNTIFNQALQQAEGLRSMRWRNNERIAGKQHRLESHWHVDQLASSNGPVQTLSYRSLKLAAVTDIYRVRNQRQLAQQLRGLRRRRAYPLSHPLLVANPFLTNTTGVYVYFKTPQPTRVTVRISAAGYADFAAKLITAPQTYSKTHEAQIIGAVGGVKNTITLTATTRDGQHRTQQFTYQPRPLQGMVANSYRQQLTAKPRQLSQGLYTVLGQQGKTPIRGAYLLDNAGVVRAEMPLAQASAQQLVVDRQRLYLGISRSRLASLNRLGQVTQVINLRQQGYELGSDLLVDHGHQIWALASSVNQPQRQDQVIKLNPRTGQITRSIQLANLLPSLYQLAISGGHGHQDVLQLNSLAFAGHQLLLSSRETSTVIAIKHPNTQPQLAYLMGDPAIWQGLGSTSAFLLQKQGAFLSMAGQHSIQVTTGLGLKAGQYYLTAFNNNFLQMNSRTGLNLQSFYRKQGGLTINSPVSLVDRYLVDPQARTYRLISRVKVPKTDFDGSVQQFTQYLIVSTGAQSQIKEYRSSGQLLQTLTNRGAGRIGLVQKLTFNQYYFAP